MSALLQEELWHPAAQDVDILEDGALTRDVVATLVTALRPTAVEQRRADDREVPIDVKLFEVCHAGALCGNTPAFPRP
jgi:hypothetical protein